MVKRHISTKPLDEDGLVIRTNKEEEKRKREEIKDLVKALLKLPTAKYADLPIDSQLAAAYVEGKRLTGNAHSRHLSYLVRLTDEQGYAAILAAYERLHHPYRNDAGKIKEIEHYRDRLIDGDKVVLDELLAKFANVDIQYVRQLARNVNREKKAEEKRQAELAQRTGQVFDAVAQPTKSSKLLYQYLFKLELL